MIFPACRELPIEKIIVAMPTSLAFSLIMLARRIERKRSIA